MELGEMVLVNTLHTGDVVAFHADITGVTVGIISESVPVGALFCDGRTRHFVCSSTLVGSTCEDKQGMEYSYLLSSTRPVYHLGKKEDFGDAETIVSVLENLKTELDTMLELEGRKDFVINVNKYFNINTTAPLRFFCPETRLESSSPEIKMYPLYEQALEVYEPLGERATTIARILFASQQYYSAYHTSPISRRVLETNPGRRRSVGDIWRHYLSIDPDITVYEVMVELHRLLSAEGGPYGISWCSTVHKLVVYPGGLRSAQYRGGKRDEFGNDLSQWPYAVEMYEESLKEDNSES